jgi:hypothetical protein
MIACRHGDDAALALGFAQGGKLHQRAAILERIGHLEVFVFDVDLRPGQPGQFRRRQHRRPQHHVLDHAAGCFDIGNGYAQHSLQT